MPLQKKVKFLTIAPYIEKVMFIKQKKKERNFILLLWINWDSETVLFRNNTIELWFIFFVKDNDISENPFKLGAWNEFLDTTDQGSSSWDNNRVKFKIQPLIKKWNTQIDSKSIQ